MPMTANQIIQEISTLAPEEQAKIVDFTRKLGIARQLTGEELGALAERMINAPTEIEADKLNEQIIRGFYGTKPHA
ncbi:MAG: hypothetical protein HY736_18190 [Verrucomicrobia bacterium]|nr:hypothetical protein [Verrucomicrobiota bacterium]